MPVIEEKGQMIKNRDPQFGYQSACLGISVGWKTLKECA